MATSAPAGPATPSAQPQQVRRIRRHHWWSAGWSAARTPRGMIGLGLVSFVVLQRVLGMDRIHAVDANAFLTELVEIYVRGARP